MICLRRVTLSLQRHTARFYATSVKLPLNFLDGKRVQPETLEEFDVFNPATGEQLCRIPTSAAKDVNQAVESGARAFQVWSQLSGSERGKFLTDAARLVRERRDVISATETMDVGKTITEARWDIDGMADVLDFYASMARTISGEHITMPNGSFAYTRREPLGVCGGIGAWNYPFQMAVLKSAPALACGNTMVFKPAPLTPMTAVMLAEVYQDVGIPEGCFNVIQGAAETGQLLSSHPKIAKMSFTGSVQTGRKVMEACAKDIKYVTLELGGKSPLIVFADADLDNAVKGAIMANFLNQGQVCSNGTRVFVERSIRDQFLEKLGRRMKAMKVGDPMEEDTFVGAMISKEQMEKTSSYIAGAKEEGAKVYCGGEILQPSPSLKGNFITPAVLVDCYDTMSAVQEEIFGSVMAVLEFDAEEEVIERANATEYGLAGGVFTKDLSRAHRVAAKIQCGSFYINTFNVTPTEVPFGGVKKSGIGREFGKVAIEFYSQLKSVYVETGDVECPV
ncbi:4-trimethylaminobutyraldehyde dehydrogenase A-like [Lineus longissimus]|uniref:4-trimethylaminobutyraldehyde dehydrogenase A-like n=1 Tax=Lineus longissimus TaxID=88925 RepID=UPI002B4C26AA